MPLGQEGHGVRHSLCPAAQPLALTVAGFTTHMIIALPGRGPVSPGPVSDTSYLWTCLGTTALLGGSSPGHWADQRVLGAEEQLGLAPSATTTGCHWWCDLQPLPDRQLSVVVVSPPRY